MSATEFTVDKQKLEVVIHRVFNAPIESVWNAHTDPELVVKWWGPRSLEMYVEKLDAREGGQWRILHRETSGKEHWFHGEFKEVVKPSKIVRTFVYEPVPDQVMTETCMFKEIENGKTRVDVITVFPSAEALNGMVSSGMEYGSRESFERLAEVVEGK